jgi:hypothetical protein
MIQIDEGICEKLGRKLKDVQVLPQEFLAESFDESSWTEEERRREVNFRFYLVAFCQHTKSLQGVIEGQWCRGWDYLERACRRAMSDNPEYFSAETVSRITGPELRSILSDDFDPGHSTLDRVEERVTQLRDCGQRLSAQYNGDAMNLYRQADGYLHGERGILELMSEFKAYSDPIRKKSFLFLMFVSQAGIWEIKDPENLKIAVDYHIMRIALRSGMVRVGGALERMLKERSEVDAATDIKVRGAVQEACDLLVRHSGHSVFEVDNILWMIGRNCCFYDHEPICGRNVCFKRDRCTLVRSIVYDCPGKCLLDGACLGSLDEEYRKLWETNLYTEYY